VQTLSGNLNLPLGNSFQIDGTTVVPLLDRGNNTITSEGSAPNLLPSVSGNVVIGRGAGNSLVNGSINTIIGSDSAIGFDGNSSVVIGNNTTGNFNDLVMLGQGQTAGGRNSIILGAGGTTSGAFQCKIHNVTQITSTNPFDPNGADLGSVSEPFNNFRLAGTAYIPLYKVPSIEQKVYSQVTTLNRTHSQGSEDMVSSPITIPANTLQAGSTLCFEVGGNCVEKKTDKIEFRLIGETATTLFTSATLECKEDTTGSQGWKLTVWITVRGSTLSLLGDWEYTKDNGNKLAGSHFNNDSVSIDTSVEQNLKWQMNLLDSSGDGILEYNITNYVVKICV
jgi:hypothetical protein